MLEHIWEVEVKNTPVIKKECSRCNSGRFCCSDKFRINAQKKYLDVWLIYRCSECDKTFNLSIFSRANPERITKGLLKRFEENDYDLVREYAFSSETVGRNGVAFDYGSVEYEIRHADTLSGILSGPEAGIVRIEVRMPFGFGLKMSSAVRYCLGLSAVKYERMVENGAVYTQVGSPNKKRKLRNGDVIMIDVGKFVGIMKP